jgi:hypothetical protein
LDGLAPHTGSERKPLAECLRLITHPVLDETSFLFLSLSRGAGLECNAILVRLEGVALFLGVLSRHPGFERQLSAELGH